MSHYKKNPTNSHRNAHGPHALMRGGAAYAAPDCYESDCLVFYTECVSPENSVAGDGHALCVCGARSPHLKSFRLRKIWRDQHRAQEAAWATYADLVMGAVAA